MFVRVGLLQLLVIVAILMIAIVCSQRHRFVFSTDGDRRLNTIPNGLSKFAHKCHMFHGCHRPLT